MDGVLRVEPFPVKNEPAAEPRLQHGALYGSPLLEQVVLRVHALGDFMATALQHHARARGEMNPDVRAVELLFHDERQVGNERLGFLWTEVLVVVRALRAEE